MSLPAQYLVFLVLLEFFLDLSLSFETKSEVAAVPQMDGPPPLGSMG